MATPGPKTLRQPTSPKPQQNPTTSAHPAPNQPLIQTPNFTPEMYKTKNLCAPLGPSRPTPDKEMKHPDPGFQPANKQNCWAFVIAT